VIIHSPDEADSAARFADDLRAGIDLPNRPFRIELIQHDGPTPSGTTWLSCTVERTLVTQVREALQTDPRKREDLAWAVRAVVFPWEPGWRQRTGLGLLYRMLALPYHAYLGPLTEGGYLLRGAQRALDELAALEVRSQSRLDICRGIRDFTTEPPVQHPGWSKVSLAYAEDLTARRNLILGGIGIVISAIALWVSLRAGGP
jgi:hypothetical protein